MTLTTNIEQFVRINKAFKPASPVDDIGLFAGRIGQIEKIVNAIMQTGLHVILYGERGVGKTSLVSILDDVLRGIEKKDWFSFVRINCDKEQGFSTLWYRVLQEITFSQEISKPRIGLEKSEDTVNHLQRAIDYVYRSEIGPDDLRLIFQKLPTYPIIVLDEVDRIEDQKVRGLLADTIKAFSDHASKATLILVGVADSVDELIWDHRSIERALVQVQLPRMSAKELHEALNKCLNEARMTMESEARQSIVATSRGLPHYTHLLGLHAARNANSENRTDIRSDDVSKAIGTAIEDASQSIRSSYVRAVHSSRQETMHKDVLLACALSRPNELGYFTASEVKLQMTQLIGRPVEVAVFARHLADFSSEKRGNILHRTGSERRFLYRFINPLMQPYVIMKGVYEKRIEHEKLNWE